MEEKTTYIYDFNKNKLKKNRILVASLPKNIEDNMIDSIYHHDRYETKLYHDVILKRYIGLNPWLLSWKNSYGYTGSKDPELIGVPTVIKILNFFHS